MRKIKSIQLHGAAFLSLEDMQAIKGMMEKNKECDAQSSRSKCYGSCSYMGLTGSCVHGEVYGFTLCYCEITKA